MSFSRERPRNYYLDDTAVPNIFIAEYLTNTPGDYVRVYLYAYMFAGLKHMANNDSIAEALGLPLEDVLAAWAFFEEQKVVRKYFPNPADTTHFEVEFVDLKGAIFGQSSEKSAAGAAGGDVRPPVLLDEREVAELFRQVEFITGKDTGRELSSADYHKISALLSDYAAPPELIAFAFRHCWERSRGRSISYACSVVKDWTDRGIFTAEAAKEFVGNTDIRYDQYKKIMRALGLAYGNITEEEKRVFDLWLDEYGLTLNEILDTSKKAAGKRNKYDYVKKIIESDQQAKAEPGGKSGGAEKAGGTAKKGRQGYYEQLRRTGELEAERRRAEVYERLPEVQALDEQISGLNMKLVSAALSGAPNKERFIRKLNADLEGQLARKTALLEQEGFPLNHMDIVYRCPLCKDTGTLDNGASCSCYIK